MYQTNTFKKLKTVKKDLKNFKSFLLNFERDAQFLTKMEQFAESIESGITGFKVDAANQFENIQDEIDILNKDLGQLEKKIEHWKNEESNPQDLLTEDVHESGDGVEPDFSKKARANSVVTGERRNAKNFDERDNVNQELYSKTNPLGKEYRDIIEDLFETKNAILLIDQKIEHNGGLNCGWPSQEHTIFTQIAFKMQNRIDSVPFMDEVSLELPLKSEPAIFAHITAYKTFKDLDKEKKNLMGQYKALKQRQKDTEAKFNSLKLKELESKQQRTKSIGRTQEQRQKDQELLIKWKRDKLVNKVLEQEKDAEVTEQVNLKKQKQKQKEMDQKKLLVEEYRQMKMMEKERQEAVKQNAMKEKQYVDPETVQRIRMKEELLLEKKQKLMTQQLEKNQQRQLFFEQNILNPEPLNDKFATVKSKLKQETMATVSKKREKFDKEKDQAKWADNMAGNLIRAQGRAQVSWRQGL